MKPIRETLSAAGYVSIEKIGKGEYILTDADGKREVWFANKNHASYGIKYRNTCLEFKSSVVPYVDVDTEDGIRYGFSIRVF